MSLTLVGLCCSSSSTNEAAGDGGGTSATGGTTGTGGAGSAPGLLCGNAKCDPTSHQCCSRISRAFPWGILARPS
ncbi:MAG: hypothetical protein IT377_14940 [Polyangiaceae bacterium]|nr:hypothetical protein [Polyangiaceae bacterium]